MPYDLFHGGVPGGDDCPPAGVPGGCGHLITASMRVYETIHGGNASMGDGDWYITNNPTTQNMTKQTLGNRSFINQVKYSPKYHSVAMVGTNDANAWIGFNLGTGTASEANWVDVTGGNTVLPNRPIMGVALDPTVSAANLPVGYAAIGGFNPNTPSMPGHVFQVTCTANCGSFTWVNKTGNLPDIPVDSIIVNPNDAHQVYAGTDWGVYYTNDITVASPTWQRFENGIPHAMVWDMQIDRGSTTLSVWTRGRGAYVYPLPAATPTPTPTPTPTATVTPTPAVTTNPATNVASFSATLNGSLNPRGFTTTVYFQYGLTTSYGSTTPMQTQTGNTVRAISTNISGLAASHVYHFRIVAHNAGGTAYGSDRTFTTLSATGPPVVITNPATFIASYSAKLNGSVNPHGLTTTVYFQYGTTNSYGSTTANQTKTGNTYQNVAANISGLSASTTYHFRIVATNSAGTVYGSDRTVTTLSATGPPVVITNPATNVASSSATLNGSVDPHGLSTTVYFQYGRTTGYGSTTPNQTKTGNTYQNVAANISGLTARTTYHFRIVATNSAGTRYGGDRTFTTP
jgi:hypothetical protein